MTVSAPSVRDALNPGVARRELFGWAMYDFANSGYTTVVLTAVFNAYFVGVVAQGAPWATLAWTLALSASHLLAMLLLPAVGAWADARGAKKRVLALATAGCVLGTASLALVGRGDLWPAVAAIVVSNLFFSAGEAISWAFLPALARPGAMGRVSGWGWSVGYFGGMLALVLCLAWVTRAQAAGQGAETFVPVTMMITAGLFAVAALPALLLLEERRAPVPDDAPAGPGALFPLLRDARLHHPDFARLLACGACYQAGIAVVIALAAVYAEAVMGFDTARTMTLLFVVNIASALGAFGFGHAQDRLGHRRALAWTLAGWLLTVAVAASATTVGPFWLAATLAGLCMGSSQSCGRALAGLFAPPGRSGAFYGLWSFATRVAAIVGPVSYGLVTWASGGDHRLAILATGLFFVAGLWLLRGVDVERGRRAAGGLR